MSLFVIIYHHFCLFTIARLHVPYHEINHLLSLSRRASPYHHRIKVSSPMISHSIDSIDDQLPISISTYLIYRHPSSLRIICHHLPWNPNHLALNMSSIITYHSLPSSWSVLLCHYRHREYGWISGIRWNTIFLVKSHDISIELVAQIIEKITMSRHHFCDHCDHTLQGECRYLDVSNLLAENHWCHFFQWTNAAWKQLAWSLENPIRALDGFQSSFQDFSGKWICKFL